MVHVTTTDMDTPKHNHYLTSIYTIAKMIVGFLKINFTIITCIDQAKMKL